MQLFPKDYVLNFLCNYFTLNHTWNCSFRFDKGRDHCSIDVIFSCGLRYNSNNNFIPSLQSGSSSRNTRKSSRRSDEGYGRWGMIKSEKRSLRSCAKELQHLLLKCKQVEEFLLFSYWRFVLGILGRAMIIQAWGRSTRLKVMQSLWEYADTPLGRHPPRQTPPLGRHPPPREDTLLGILENFCKMIDRQF